MNNVSRIKVLWLSSTPGLYNASSNVSGYYGGGWISSLQKIVQDDSRISLALAFPADQETAKIVTKHAVYYRLYKNKLKGFKKLSYYYGGYKKNTVSSLLSGILWAIDDFQPDVIQLFGIESELACILGETDVPVVVHLQGILAPYDNAFFPPGFNKYSFSWPPSIREWIFRNGYIFAKNSIKVRGEREEFLFKKARYLMGRTDWDRHVSSLLAPQALYFHVDEVLRDVFYENAGTWVQPKGRITIVSTISNTVYKGLDLILKTAQLLKSELKVEFAWKVFGISCSDAIVKVLERETRIKGDGVNVVYGGPKTSIELCHELLDAHVYVHPSYIDNSPNSVCEAQMLGVPIIATNVGGLSTLIEHCRTGLLVPANAPYELAYWLKELIGNKMVAESLSVNGSQMALERHNKSKIVQSLFSAYLQMDGE